jgi:DNA-binding MarR family transcriptional regulator
VVVLVSDVSIEDVELHDLPPSCKFVYKEVARQRTINRSELIDETWLPERTLYDAINRLENRGYVSVARDSDDLRQVVVKIAEL